MNDALSVGLMMDEMIPKIICMVVTIGFFDLWLLGLCNDNRESRVSAGVSFSLRAAACVPRYRSSLKLFPEMGY